MADLLKKQVFCRIGVNSTPTDRLGAPSTYVYIPNEEDGTPDGVNINTFEIATEHAVPGLKYGPFIGSKNTGAQQFKTPIYPENAKFLLDMALALQSTGLPAYHTFEQYFNVTLGGSPQVIGRKLAGMIAQGFTVAFDRENPAGLSFQLDHFINADYQITTSGLAISAATNASPIVITSATHGYTTGDVVTIAGVAGNTAANGTWTIIVLTSTTFSLTGSTGNGAYTSGGTSTKNYPGYSFPTQSPYLTKNCFVDVVLADSSNNLGAYTGDKLDLLSLSMNYSAPLEPKLFLSSTTPELDQTWTKVFIGDPKLEITGQLQVSDGSYLNLSRLSDLRKLKCRIMAYGSSPSGSSTSATNLAASGTSIVVASATGFAIGDVIILIQPTANLQQVVTITNIVTTTLTITAADIAMNGGTETILVRNTAFELRCDLARITAAPSKPSNSGLAKVVNFTATVVLAAGATSIMSRKAYNDDNT